MLKRGSIEIRSLDDMNTKDINGTKKIADFIDKSLGLWLISDLTTLEFLQLK